MDDTILAAPSKLRQQVWKRFGEHTLLKSPDVHPKKKSVTHPTRLHATIHEHGKRGFRVRLPKEYMTALRPRCNWKVVDREQFPGRELDQQLDKLDRRSEPWEWRSSPYTEQE